MIESSNKLSRRSRPLRSIRRNRRRRHDRRGAVTVEMAVCLPVLVIVTLGFIDLTNFIYFRQAVKVAAYDAARTAIEPTASTTEVQAAAQRLLDARQIDNWTLTLPNNFSSISRGELVQLSLTVPISEMSNFSGMEFWQGTNSIVVDIAAVKE